MKTGIGLITKERIEQIEKHNRSIVKDVELNNDKQLSIGAEALISKDWSYGFDNENDFNLCPDGWDYEVWMKMYNKPYKERLVIAGALIAAEIDRIQATEPLTEHEEDKFAKLREAADPLLKYLAENHHPHVTGIVTSTSIELVEGLMNIPNIMDHIKD